MCMYITTDVCQSCSLCVAREKWEAQCIAVSYNVLVCLSKRVLRSKLLLSN